MLSLALQKRRKLAAYRLTIRTAGHQNQLANEQLRLSRWADAATLSVHANLNSSVKARSTTAKSDIVDGKDNRDLGLARKKIASCRGDVVVTHQRLTDQERTNPCFGKTLAVRMACNAAFRHDKAIGRNVRLKPFAYA